LAACGAAVVGLTFGMSWLAVAPAGALPVTLYVAPGAPGGGDTSCATAQYATITAAAAAAAGGDTIQVCAGTYKESVSLTTKSLTISGPASGSPAVIDAAGLVNGISIGSAATANSTVEHLTVENAKREGISIGGTSGITLLDNIVTGNDQMCQPQVTEDDCGESIDLEAVTNSVINGNTATKGTGGILISDGIPPGSIGAQAFGGPTPFYGPTSGNTIENNTVTDNVWDCGITMPSHNSTAFGKNGITGTGGVFNNTISGNTVENNGTAGGGGSGILMAGPFPGTAVYDNTVSGNTILDNGQGGFVLHSHAPGQDLNGNKITGNIVGTNAIGQKGAGVGVFTSPTTQGDPGAGNPATTGIEIFAPVVPVTGTVIQNNNISNNHYGVWVYNAPTTNVGGDVTKNVTVPTYFAPLVDTGYSSVTTTGLVASYGKNATWGNPVGLTGGSPVVGIAATPDAGGYWIVTANGGVFSYGDATFYGSTGGVKLVQPIVGITATPTGHGYWLVAADGGVFSYGDATFYGSTGGVKLVKPVVGITTTPDGGGYWLVASDGGVFSFGDATFFGSTGGVKLVKPVVGIAPSSTGQGYWLVASDGGVFSFGDATFFGSTGGVKLVAPVVGIHALLSNGGYWLVASDGGVFNFGTAPFAGSGGGNKLGSPVVGITSGQPFLAG
jgi:parallel beta-helix repeat protein